ncbi:MAG: response regulator [Chitinispirillaceae bacterium]|nr:response regulator [Chitinispirillaceae bacterium]
MEPEKKHILVVDDEFSICEVLGQYLKKDGYNVTMASSGEEALEVLGKSPVHLIISDIKMPGISGVDLLKHVKETDGALPVLMTTGFPTLDTAIEALKLGAYDYMTKPFHLEEIGEKVKRAFSTIKLQEENVLFSKLVSLHEVTKELTATLEVNELNYKFLDFSLRMVKADGGALLLVDHMGKLAITETAGEHFTPAYWLNQPFVATSRFVAQQQEPALIIMDATPPHKELPPLPPEVCSLISFPLKTPSRVIGVLNLVRLKQHEPHTDLDMEIVNVLASQASIAIENVRLYSNIRDNYLKTIRAFALAVEAKDEYTHGHSENVMKYTVVLAKRLGLPDHEIELVKYAGLLHDIGKIGVSENILNKAGKLTTQEFEEIKKHPELGARIISDVPFLKSLVPMVLHHHEFFNGCGYPLKIAGNSIPFGARILSVADAYEAMTSDRPYRKSLSIEVAFNILIEERGKQFDPQVVDAFLDIMQPGKTAK